MRTDQLKIGQDRHPADHRLRRMLTGALRPPADTGEMEEPTHANESAFWDHVADWLMGNRTLYHGPMSQDEIQAILRDEDDRRNSH